MKFDFDKIRRENPLPDVVSRSGVKLEADGNEFKACCPFHGEKTPSFTLYRAPNSDWKYHCFGCGIHGDVVDFVKERYGYPDTGEAARWLTGEDRERQPLSTAEYKEATDPYDGYDIKRPPADTKEIVAGVRTPPILNPKRVNPQNGKPKVITYTPSMVFPYRDKHGDLMGYVLRIEFDDKKITPGVWWTVNKAAGFEGWSHGSFPDPRPLYGLDRLYAEPDHQVLLVEGEKCKDAAERIMQAEGKKVVAVSWMGGGKAIRKTYWKSLKGRSVIIWPDNDAEGWKTTMGWPAAGGSWNKGLVELLFEAGAARIKVVHIDPAAREEGWDIADAERELGSAGTVMLMAERVQQWSRERFDHWKARQIEKEMPHGKDDAARVERVSPGKTEPAKNAQREGETSGDHTGRNEAGGNEPDSQPADSVSGQSVGEGNGVAANPVGRGFGITEDTWRQHLIMKADGDGLKSNSSQNVALILQYERRFAGIFAWNEFAKEVYLLRRPPWDISGTMGYWRTRKLMETDIVACAGWLEYTGMSPKINDVGRIIVRVAEHNKYNPVIEAMETLQWDGIQRINGRQTDEGDSVQPWLAEYMGAEANEVNRLFGEKWLVGAVARAFQPGCKMDNMLVLEGEQGLQKSTALRVLSDAVAPGVFTDEMSDPNSKDAALQMQGAFIVEVAELDAFRRAEITQIKAWLTRQTDRFRRPYGKVVEEFPRSCVFAGTVNPLGNTGYLKDPTGGRRFWPVKVEHIDIERLKIDARQLWAEAIHLYKNGTRWWLAKDEDAKAGDAQKHRYEDDPYGELIDQHTRGRTTVSLQELLSHLEIPKERRNAIVSRRITSHMMVAGWQRELDDGKVIYKRNVTETLV